MRPVREEQERWLGSRRALLVERRAEMASVQDADPGTSSMGGQQARLLSLAGGRARRAKSGLVVDCEGEGMTPETRGTRPPGGNDLVELGLGRSIGHKRVPRRRRGETRCRLALDVHYGMDGTAR